MIQLSSSARLPQKKSNADVAELVDAHASGACGRKSVWVRVPPSAQNGGRSTMITTKSNCHLLSIPSQGIIGPLIGICATCTYHLRPGGEMVYTYA